MRKLLAVLIGAAALILSHTREEDRVCESHNGCVCLVTEAGIVLDCPSTLGDNNGKK